MKFARADVSHLSECKRNGITSITYRAFIGRFREVTELSVLCSIALIELFYINWYK